MKSDSWKNDSFKPVLWNESKTYSANNVLCDSQTNDSYESNLVMNYSKRLTNFIYNFIAVFTVYKSRIILQINIIRINLI